VARQVASFTGTAVRIASALDRHALASVADLAIGAVTVDGALGTGRLRTDGRTAIASCVAITATVFAGTQVARALVVVVARLAELQETAGITTVPGDGVAVVATFARFDQAVATAERDAHIMIGSRVADLLPRAIVVVVTRANIVDAVARTARAIVAVFARLVEFQQTRRTATIARNGVAVVARLRSVDSTVAAPRFDALVRVGRFVADFSFAAVVVLVAGANVVDAVARTARAIVAVFARLVEFEQTGGTATIAGGGVAVVAAFPRFDLVIAAPGRQAHVGIWLGVADLRRGAIVIFGAGAHVRVRIAQAARAGSVVFAYFAELEQTLGVAAVAGNVVTVVAPLGRFDSAVAATRFDTLVRVRRFVADFGFVAIGVLVTGANVADGVARAARAIGVVFAGLVEFEQTGATATIARGGVAVIAAFARVDLAIAATGREAHVGVGLRVADLREGAIVIVGAGAHIRIRVAQATRTGSAFFTCFTELEQTLRVAAVEVLEVRIVAAFTQIEHAVAATWGYALVRIGIRVARLTQGAIIVVVASANVCVGVTQPARTAGAVVARFAELEQALGIAPVARNAVTVVAPLGSLDPAVAAPGFDTLVRARRFVADFALVAIGVLVTGANVVIRVASAACAIGALVTFLAQLQAAIGVTTVAGVRVAVIAAFAEFNQAIAAT